MWQVTSRSNEIDTYYCNFKSPILMSQNSALNTPARHYCYHFACNHDLLFCKDDDAIFSDIFFSPVSTAIKPWIVCLYLLVPSMQHEGNDFAILLSENPKCSLWPTNYVLISKIYLGAVPSQKWRFLSPSPSLSCFYYRKVASSSISRLVAHLMIFRRLLKGKFDAYVVWPLAKKFQNSAQRCVLPVCFPVDLLLWQ